MSANETRQPTEAARSRSADTEGSIHVHSAPMSSGAVAGVSRREKTTQPSLWDVLGPAGRLQFGLIAAGVTWLYWDHFVRLFRYWRDDPDWSHGFLIPPFSLYFLHTKRHELSRLPVRTNWFGLVILLGAIAMYFAAIYLKYGYPQPVSIVAAITGLVLFCCGWQILKTTGFAIFFLMLALPPPVRLYRNVTQPLQQFAAMVSEKTLGMLPGVFMERSGINLSFQTEAGRTGYFTVAGACSGMRSLMAFIAIGLAMAYFAPRPMWQRIIMALVVLPVAVFCNIVRVVATGAFQIYGYGNLAAGTPHAVLGIVMFAIGFGIYFALLYIMDHLFIADEDSEATGGAAA